MPIYTRFGDKGYTSILGGIRLSKDDDIFDAIGTIDELNALIGLLRSYIKEDTINKELKKIQGKLNGMNVEVVSRYSKKIDRYRKYFLRKDDIDEIEENIDKYESRLPPQKKFILYSGSSEASLAFYTRAVCRRAERILVRICRRYKWDDSFIIPYLNRLGDLLFIYGRYLNHLKEISEEYWEDDEKRG